MSEHDLDNADAPAEVLLDEEVTMTEYIGELPDEELMADKDIKQDLDLSNSFFIDVPKESGYYLFAVPTDLEDDNLNHVSVGDQAVHLNTKGEGAVKFVDAEQVFPLSVVQEVIKNYVGAEEIGWGEPIPDMLE